MKTKRLLYCTLLLTNIFALTPKITAKEIGIENWPFSDDFTSTDTFTKKLFCPSLTELNLLKKKSTNSIIDSVVHTKKKWVIKWPKNLRWWDGKKVTDAEKVVFIRTHLDKYGKFAISFNNQESVLSWSREPGIGPYIFNNKPFKKLTNNGLGYICTGEYEPISIGKTKLKLRKGKSIITFTTGKLPDDHPNKITFILGSEYSNTPWTRLPDKKISCKKSMSLPVVSLIDWDISKSPSNKRDFRIASTNLLPRGNILRAGSAFMGSLVTYPNLKAHPGYNRSLKIRSYSIPRAKKGMEQYRGKKIFLKANSNSSYVKKTIEEHFHLAGLEVVWTDSADNHGAIKSLFLPWPELIIKKDSDSKSSKYNDLIKKYEQSLTFDVPRFSLLRKAQQVAYNEELFTVLHSHRACVKWTMNKEDMKLPRLILRDPNWLSKLLQNLTEKGA